MEIRPGITKDKAMLFLYQPFLQQFALCLLRFQTTERRRIDHELADMTAHAVMRHGRLVLRLRCNTANGKKNRRFEFEMRFGPNGIEADLYDYNIQPRYLLHTNAVERLLQKRLRQIKPAIETLVDQLPIVA
jgi:hypothetical protein